MYIRSEPIKKALGQKGVKEEGGNQEQNEEGRHPSKHTVKMLLSFPSQRPGRTEASIRFTLYVEMNEDEQ
ncbi:hypothetical protein OUZ56_031980 [Daphnia magna]|uniref:Uncharacterized protein n=1 Tax=Daphnia magna TaxID=35525 RepID=A0ABQ9ZVV6_9CRUS|nr:hypothetical protein OUZ56_031980 [Daphnia magna]